MHRAPLLYPVGVLQCDVILTERKINSDSCLFSFVTFLISFNPATSSNQMIHNGDNYNQNKIIRSTLEIQNCIVKLVNNKCFD